MSGFCGIIGGQPDSIKPMQEILHVLGHEAGTTYQNGPITIAYVDHPRSFENQPATLTTPDVSLWIWGDILGHEHQGTYTTRSPTEDAATFTARLYEEHGASFVHGLNSEFTGIIHDRDAETLTLFTDRLGSRPLYHARTPTGNLVFSSLLQGLNAHPNTTLTLDPERATQFLAYNRTLGTHTATQQARLLPPATLTTYDHQGERTHQRTYWQPQPNPEPRTFNDTVDRFHKALTHAIEERAQHASNPGLLLSGGTDSRTILAAHPGTLTAIHLNEDTTDYEAATAARVAEQANTPFRFLERGPDYHERVLNNAKNILSFNGLYHSAKVIGFAKEINDEVDALFCGQYADAIVGIDYVPLDEPRPSFLKHLRPATRSRNIQTPQAYADAFPKDMMPGDGWSIPYVKNTPDPKAILLSSLHDNRGTVTSHGVTYPSWKALCEHGMVYPLTNTRTFINYETLIHMIPTRYPFLDNRILDLVLETPTGHLYARYPVKHVLHRISPALAQIPHSETGVALTSPRIIEKAGIARRLAQQSLQDRANPNQAEPTHKAPGSWMNHAGLIRLRSFVEDTLTEHEDRIEHASFLDLDRAWRCYHEHLNGSDHTYALYALVTLLETGIEIPRDPPNDRQNDGEERN